LIASGTLISVPDGRPGGPTDLERLIDSKGLHIPRRPRDEHRLPVSVQESELDLVRLVRRVPWHVDEDDYRLWRHLGAGDCPPGADHVRLAARVDLRGIGQDDHRLHGRVPYRAEVLGRTTSGVLGLTVRLTVAPAAPWFCRVGVQLGCC
jgi:hypothetical protein